jgi:antitoxin component of MazEF toxin-antitoxin module
MEQTIGVWGNNHAVRIPKELDTFESGEKVNINQLEDGSICITPAARLRSLKDLLNDLQEMKWHYMELIEATPTRDIDSVATRARAKTSVYSEIASELGVLLQKYGV